MQFPSGPNAVPMVRRGKNCCTAHCKMAEADFPSSSRFAWTICSLEKELSSILFLISSIFSNNGYHYTRQFDKCSGKPEWIINMESNLKIGGIVLCGGQSTRMGRSKAWLAFGKETMLQRVVRILSETLSPIIVVAAPDQE